MRQVIPFGTLSLLVLLFLDVQWADCKRNPHHFELGSEDMVIDAGARPVDPSPPRKVVEVYAPGRLGKADTEYRLMNDVVAEGTAFTVTAHRVTLNLNGHTVTYNQKVPGCGVFLSEWWLKDVSIINGRIKQGHANSSGNKRGKGCNPIRTLHCKRIEIAGITAVYSGPDVAGFYIEGCHDAHIHHNTLEDQGSHIMNRHQGIDAIKVKGAGGRIHHNLIKRCRQIGIRADKNSEVSHNEVHIDSCCTNSTGISVGSGSIHHNKVYGKGQHPIGIWPGNHIKVYSNYVEVQNTKRSVEYGSPGAACLRMTWGNDDVEVMYNTFVLHAEKDHIGTGMDSWGRALWVGLPKPEQKAVFHNNVIIANNRKGKAKAAAIAIVCKNNSPNLIFRNNKVISNWGNVLLSDKYGHSDGYPTFVENTFVKKDGFSRYHTIRCGYWTNPSTGIFINNHFEEGATIDDVAFDGSGKREILVQHYLELLVKDQSGNPIPEAQVVVSDVSNVEVFRGTTDAEGKIKTPLTSYIHRPEGKDIRTPHSFTVRKEGFGVKTGVVRVKRNTAMEAILTNQYH